MARVAGNIRIVTASAGGNDGRMIIITKILRTMALAGNDNNSNYDNGSSRQL